MSGKCYGKFAIAKSTFYPLAFTDGLVIVDASAYFFRRCGYVGAEGLHGTTVTVAKNTVIAYYFLLLRCPVIDDVYLLSISFRATCCKPHQVNS